MKTRRMISIKREQFTETRIRYREINGVMVSSSEFFARKVKENVFAIIDLHKMSYLICTKKHVLLTGEGRNRLDCTNKVREEMKGLGVKLFAEVKKKRK